MTDVIAFKAKRRQLPIPADSCSILSTLGIQVGSAEYGVRYNLRTSKEGVQMMLTTGCFSWNLSHMLNVWPANFKEARAFLNTYAAQHGQTFEEVEPRHPRSKRATGDDAKFLKAGGCRESWLSSDVNSLLGEALFRCRNAAGGCDTNCAFGSCDMEMDVPINVEEEA